MPDLKRIKDKILQAKSIVISGHRNPDGDSIGSLLGLGLGLKTLGKHIYMLSSDGLPKRYKFLPGASGVSRKLDKSVDLAISVDCANKEILGKAFDVFVRAKDILEIDHHEFRRPFGNLSLIDKKAAAVGEIIYILLEDLKIKLNKEIATNLLTSIVVETNSFRLPNVRPLTFEICMKLLKKHVNFHSLVDRIYWSVTKESAMLLGICLARCKFLKNNRLAWSMVGRKDFLQVRGKDEDADAVANEILAIKNVQVVVLFREQPNNTLRVSLRSKGKINVAGIAEDYRGGGHFDVAGCYIPNNAKAINDLLRKANKLLD